MKFSEQSLIPLLAAGSASAFNCTPAAFEAVLPENASVVLTRTLPANSTFTVSAGDVAYPTSPTGLNALCAVQVKVQSSNISAYDFGLFLPTEWNERFLYVSPSCTGSVC